MKTNKQIYLMMENVGRELYQTINSLDQIVITKAEFDKCFSGAVFRLSLFLHCLVGVLG